MTATAQAQPRPAPQTMRAGFGIGGSPMPHLGAGTVWSRRKAARDQNHVRARVGGCMNVVDHLRLRQHTRRGIAHGAVERTAIIEGRTRDAASFTLLRRT